MTSSTAPQEFVHVQEPTIDTSAVPKVDVKPKPITRDVANADIKPRITVVGVGGAGCNAVNNMIRSQLEGVEFIVMNTDAQALTQSLTEKRVRLGDEITQGLGAGSSPEVGRAAAEEALEEILHSLKGSNMVFIAAGMGGGTGTGAASVIARAAREMGILTVGVVTKPFNFEGAHRMRTAESGIDELQKHVDTLIVIPNQNLFRVANENTTFADAFKMADDVLYAGVRGITDLMIMPGLINLDFADVRTIMSEMGKAMMGTGEADGEGRAIAAAEAAISNPLLEDVTMRGATGVLISITGGMDMTLFEVDEAANRIREEVETDANIIFGSTFDDRLNGKVRVSVVATGIESQKYARQAAPSTQQQTSASSQGHQVQSQTQGQPQPSPAQRTFIPNTSAQNHAIPAQEDAARPKLDLTGASVPHSPEPELKQPLKTDSSHMFEEITEEDLPYTNPHHTEFEESEESEKSTGFLFDYSAPKQSSGQMEIQFGETRDAPRAQSKGGFLSRFFGRKNTVDPVHSSSQIRYTTPKNSIEEDDDLDVPTFMRRQGGGH